MSHFNFPLAIFAKDHLIVLTIGFAISDRFLRVHFRSMFSFLVVKVS